MATVESRATVPVISAPSLREVLAVAFRRKLPLLLALFDTGRGWRSPQPP